MSKPFKIQVYRPAGRPRELTGDALVEWVITQRRQGLHPIGLPGEYMTAVHNWLVRNPNRVKELIDVDAPSQCTISPLDSL